MGKESVFLLILGAPPKQQQMTSRQMATPKPVKNRAWTGSMARIARFIVRPMLSTAPQADVAMFIALCASSLPMFVCVTVMMSQVSAIDIFRFDRISIRSSLRAGWLGWVGGDADINVFNLQVTTAVC